MKARNATWAFCTLAVAGSPHPGASAQSAEVAPALDYLSLSGVWTGNMSVLQRGKCSMNRSGRSDARVKFRLSVDENGALVARPESSLLVTNAGALDLGGSRAASSGLPAKPWMGRVSPDLVVKLQAPGAAVCQRQPREFSVAYVGAIIEKAGRRQLALAANVAICPDMACSFRIELDLRQSSDARRKE